VQSVFHHLLLVQLVADAAAAAAAADDATPPVIATRDVIDALGYIQQRADAEAH